MVLLDTPKLISSCLLILVALIASSRRSSQVPEEVWRLPRRVHQNFGPDVEASKGQVWPKAAMQATKPKYYSVDPKNFTFIKLGHTCDLLDVAIQRYQKFMFEDKIYGRVFTYPESYNNHFHDGYVTLSPKYYRGTLNELAVILGAECEEWPTENSLEGYTLTIGAQEIPTRCYLRADSIWGVMQGLETFSQLLWMSDDKKALIVNETVIRDYPFTRHRGILIDTARHFLHLEVIFKMIDAMSINKFNVLHWHLSDDQSFSLNITTMPELSINGTFTESMVYNGAHVASVLNYARNRGIRVIPELDSPGRSKYQNQITQWWPPADRLRSQITFDVSIFYTVVAAGVGYMLIFFGVNLLCSIWQGLLRYRARERLNPEEGNEEWNEL